MLFEDRLKLLQQHLKNELELCQKTSHSGRYQLNKISNLYMQAQLLNKLAEQTPGMEFASDEHNPKRAVMTFLGKTHPFKPLLDAEKRALLYDRYRDVCRFIRETDYDDGEKTSLDSAITAFMQAVKATPLFTEKLEKFSFNERWLNTQRGL